MSKSIHHIITGLLAVTLLIGAGCEKTVEIDPPLNQVSTSLVFASDVLARSARSGMFSSLSQITTQSQNLTVFSSLQADDLSYLSTVVNLQEFNNNTYSIVSSSHPAIFSDWYSIIYRANAIIIGLATSTGTTETARKQYTAEAKLIRAYCYFNLVNTFGDVPLVLLTDPSVTAFQPKETTANIYRQIILDLNDAKTDLLTDYTATTGDRAGVNKFTAAGLLARVYLFTGDYAAAESNASEVIGSSQYSIIPQANMATGPFLRNNTESIWQMAPPILFTNQYTNEGAAFLPSSNTLITLFYRINPAFTALFESADLRRSRWMSDSNFGGVIYTVPFKYKYRTQALAVTAGVSESQTVMRLAEQYLIRAEARARIGTNLSGALSDMNVIRARAGASISTTTVAANLLNEIALENRKEFFCEQAFRWYNLKRTGQADAVLGALKTSYRPAAKLLPIPQSAIDANPNLTQNPGY